MIVLLRLFLLLLALLLPLLLRYCWRAARRSLLALLLRGRLLLRLALGRRIVLRRALLALLLRLGAAGAPGPGRSLLLLRGRLLRWCLGWAAGRSWGWGRCRSRAAEGPSCAGEREASPRAGLGREPHADPGTSSPDGPASPAPPWPAVAPLPAPRPGGRRARGGSAGTGSRQRPPSGRRDARKGAGRWRPCCTCGRKTWIWLPWIRAAPRVRSRRSGSAAPAGRPPAGSGRPTRRCCRRGRRSSGSSRGYGSRGRCSPPARAARNRCSAAAPGNSAPARRGRLPERSRRRPGR